MFITLISNTHYIIIIINRNYNEIVGLHVKSKIIKNDRALSGLVDVIQIICFEYYYNTNLMQFKTSSFFFSHGLVSSLGFIPQLASSILRREKP